MNIGDLVLVPGGDEAEVIVISGEHVDVRFSDGFVCRRVKKTTLIPKDDALKVIDHALACGDGPCAEEIRVMEEEFCRLFDPGHKTPVPKNRTIH